MLSARFAQTYSTHIDPDTGYWFYENRDTGERHWDRPLKGVVKLCPKPPNQEDETLDAV